MQMYLDGRHYNAWCIIKNMLVRDEVVCNCMIEGNNRKPKK